MEFWRGRGLAVDLVEKTNEFLMPMAGHALADNLALQHVESGKQGRRAVAFVIVGHRPAATALHRQPRLGAVERLNLMGSSNRSPFCKPFLRSGSYAGFRVVFAVGTRPSLGSLNSNLKRSALMPASNVQLRGRFQPIG
jgi:hypothetical protein